MNNSSTLSFGGYLWRFVVTLLLISFVLALGTAFWVNQQIFSPAGRGLSWYHLERLKAPASFGLTIRAHQCLQGRAPCLLIEPSVQGPSPNGQLLRAQVAALGVRVPDYGQMHTTLVLLHGRNGRKESLLGVAERFTALGFRCVLIDLPGHGESALKATAFGASRFERELPGQVLAEVRQQFALPEEPAALWGLSMGGAFALSAAANNNTANNKGELWQAAVIVSSFAELKGVLQTYVPERWAKAAPLAYPLLDLVQWLRLRPGLQQMQPQQWAQHVQVPTMVVHGDRDRFVPPSQGQALYERLGSREKHWVLVAEAGHNNVLSTSMPLYAEMGAWLLTHTRRTR